MASTGIYEQSLPFVPKSRLHNLKVFTTDYPQKKCFVNSSIYQANLLWQTLPSEVADCSISTLF